jgi:molybdenum cofactor guanylyltransferase
MTAPLSIGAAIVLSGGAGSRLGGVDKSALIVGGIPMLDRVAEAVEGIPLVLVGPRRWLAWPAISTREYPPGGGPAAGVAAGVAALPPVAPDQLVVLLAADLPGITPDTVQRVCNSVVESGAEGAVLVDEGGNEQLLTSAWRSSSLVAAVRSRPDWAGQALREMLAPMSRVWVPAIGDEAADVDTPADLARWRR